MGKTKFCKKCGQEKPLNEFHKWKFGSDGLKPVCKPCNTLAACEYQKKNRKARSDYWAGWFSKNKDSRRSYMAKYEEANKDRLSFIRSIAAKRPHRIAARKEYELSAAHLIKIIKRAYKARRKGMEAAGGDYPNSGWFSLLGEEQRWKCALCFLSMDSPTIDHVIPVTRGGNNNVNNLQLLCGRCNSKKSNKLLTEIKPEQFWL